MQLDIFDHSRDTMLRNDIVDALERREETTAGLAWRTFTKEFPLDDALPALAVLVDALGRNACVPFPDHEAVRDARHAVTEKIESAASRKFGKSGGAAWLVPLWREMAQRASQLPFRPDCSEDHAAALWLRAGDWSAANDAVQRVESWRRIPAPLAWMTEARYRVDGLDAVWALLAELAWLSPGRFDQLVKRLSDPLLERLRGRFEASFDGTGDVSDLAWFPAWVLTEKPALSRLLGEAQRSVHTAPEQAMRLLLELLGLEKQGRHRDMIDRRKVLRDVYPLLYAAYMTTR
jgi:hypothetical protein